MGGRANNRGGGSGGRGRRGGRRGGRSGRGGVGGRKANGAPPPPPPPPTEALVLTLSTTSSSAFYDAVSQLPTPFIETKDDTTLTLTEWNKQNITALLSWFTKGLAADPEAALSFSPLLNKHYRAQIHNTVQSNGLDSLIKTVSQGVGDSRCTIVVSKKNEKVSRPKTDPITIQNAMWLRRWLIQDQGVTLSQDEAVELMSQGEEHLPANMKRLWEERLPCQLTCHSLCMAAAVGDIQAAERALSANPQFKLSLTSHLTEVESGETPLHVAAAENQCEFLEWMLNKGANPSAVNTKGQQTPYELARKMENCDAEGVFVRLGADVVNGGNTTSVGQQQDVESNTSTCGSSSSMAYQNSVVASGPLSVKSNTSNAGGGGGGGGGDPSTSSTAAGVGKQDDDGDTNTLQDVCSGWGVDVEEWKKWGREHRQELVAVAAVAVASSVAVAGMLIASRRRF